MAIVRYFPAEGAPVLVPLHKPVTTLGRALGNDIAIPDPSVAHHHAQIVFNGRDFQLEESDREVQNSLRALESRCVKLSHVTSELVANSVESRDRNRSQVELLQKEIQKSATAQQEMLSEMFLAIDDKIEQLALQVDQKVESLAKKVEADMREAAAVQERKMQELEAKCRANSGEAANRLENRLLTLERSSNSEKENLHQVFAGGLSSMADRLKALRDS